jgi:hypothetical protein
MKLPNSMPAPRLAATRHHRGAQVAAQAKRRAVQRSCGNIPDRLGERPYRQPEAAGLTGATPDAYITWAVGRMAEWLCNGLQIRPQRFDSASGLHSQASQTACDSGGAAAVAGRVAHAAQSDPSEKLGLPFAQRIMAVAVKRG